MEAKLIMVVNEAVFGELTNAIIIAMDEHGHHMTIGKHEHDYGRDMTIVIKALRNYGHGGIPGKKILYQPEELWNRRERGVYDLSNGWHRVLELYPENVKIPRGTSNVKLCPIGWSPAFESNLPKVKEDIDVYFYGAMTERRQKFFNSLSKELPDLNIRVAEGEYGIERDKMIARSKIVMNVKAHDMWSYGPLHCIFPQCRKKLVICEKANGGYSNFTPGLHFIEFNNINDAVEKVRYWVDHKEARVEFTEMVYENIRREHNFTKYFGQAMSGLI